MKWWEIAVAAFAAVIYVQVAAHLAARNVWTVISSDLQEIKAQLMTLNIKMDELQETAREITD